MKLKLFVLFFALISNAISRINQIDNDLKKKSKRLRKNIMEDNLKPKMNSF